MDGNIEIAIVDDDQFFRFITTKQLIKARLEPDAITPFENGREAIDSLKERDAAGVHFPDAILLDLNMPMLDGWGFMDEWNSLFADRYSYVQIYICTSSLDDEDVFKAKQMDNIQDYIVKPIKADVIERVVMEVLAH